MHEHSSLATNPFWRSIIHQCSSSSNSHRIFVFSYRKTNQTTSSSPFRSAAAIQDFASATLSGFDPVLLGLASAHTPGIRWNVCSAAIPPRHRFPSFASVRRKLHNSFWWCAPRQRARVQQRRTHSAQLH